MNHTGNKSISYTFHYKESCDMCGSPADNHKKVGQRMNLSQGLRPKSKIGVSVSIMKCNVCDLIYANPQPIPNSSEDHDFASVWAAEYFDYNDDYAITDLETTKDLLDFQEGMKALDVGAGIGKYMVSLQKAGFDACGIEPSENACEIAFEKMRIPRENLQCKGIEDTEFPENIFDFINFGAVLEHLYSPSESLKTALKWLKPSGIIFAEIPNSDYFISKLFNSYYRLYRTDYTCHVSPMHAPYHHFEFGVKSFEKFCEKNDCEIVHHHISVCVTPFVPKILVPVVDTYMKWANKGMQLTVYLRKKG